MALPPQWTFPSARRLTQQATHGHKDSVRISILCGNVTVRSENTILLGTNMSTKYDFNLGIHSSQLRNTMRKQWDRLLTQCCTRQLYHRQTVTSKLCRTAHIFTPIHGNKVNATPNCFFQPLSR